MAAKALELDAILPEMTSRITEAMAALHSVQAAMIKANGQAIPRQSNQFQEIRRQLKQYWEAIASMLKKCNSVAGEVGRLHIASQASNKEQLSQLLHELISSCKMCRDQANELLEKHKIPLQCYTRYEARFSATLRHPSDSSGSRGGNNSLKSYGEESMVVFANACDVLGQQIQNLVKFFDGQVEACERYLAAVEGSSKDVSLQETELFAERWKRSRGVVLKAYVDILAVCDAIMIPAGAIPSQGISRRDSESHSGSWFEDLWNLFVTWLGLQHSTVA